MISDQEWLAYFEAFDSCTSYPYHDRKANVQKKTTYHN